MLHAAVLGVLPPPASETAALPLAAEASALAAAAPEASGAASAPAETAPAASGGLGSAAPSALAAAAASGSSKPSALAAETSEALEGAAPPPSSAAAPPCLLAEEVVSPEASPSPAVSGTPSALAAETLGTACSSAGVLSGDEALAAPRSPPPLPPPTEVPALDADQGAPATPLAMHTSRTSSGSPVPAGSPVLAGALGDLSIVGDHAPSAAAKCVVVVDETEQQVLADEGGPDLALASRDQEKREALRECFEEDCESWRQPFHTLPTLMFLVWAVDNGKEVEVISGSDKTLLLDMAPELRRGFRAGEADEPPKQVLACTVTADPATGARYMTWPTPRGVNHWHACRPVRGDEVAPHDVCGGRLCGGGDAICVGPVLAECLAAGVVPVPTAADGDCGADVLCVWENGPRSREGRADVRGRFLKSVRRKVLGVEDVDADRWLSVYDTMDAPQWKEKLEKKQEGRRAREPLAEELADVDWNPVPKPKAKTAPRELRERLSRALPASSAEADDQDVLDAMAWAANCHIRPSDENLRALAQGLEAACLEGWVTRWREARGTNEPDGTGSGARGPRAPPRRRNRSYLVAKTMKLADLYLQGRSKTSRARPGTLQKFLAKHHHPQDKASVQHFRRVMRRAGGRGMLKPLAKTHDRRVRGKQGAHRVKSPIIKEELFRWFCTMRGSVVGRMPLRVLRTQALNLRRVALASALRNGEQGDVPEITSMWLYRFRKAYGISLRKPNRRWKVPRRVLLSRLRTMWSNVIRVRVLATLLLGYDLAADGFDQKPFHVNEAGSKQAPTLALRGAPEVALKELHNETRERWTVNTMVTSRQDYALAGPHCEVLFKGGPQIARKLAEGAAEIAEQLGMQRVTTQTSNSGSYRMEHVLTWMERALPRSREDDGRWRLLFCDCYRAHEGDAVLRLAWQHKYVVLLHGGGTTGVAQVNDTHLHGALSKVYQDLEMKDCWEQMCLQRHGVPKRDRLRCVRDLCACWRAASLHVAALAGWTANMLTNNLDGTEDHLASKEIAAFWRELQMNERRTQLIEEVCQEFEQGRVEWSFEFVYSLVERFESTGFLDYYEEGQEDEGENAAEEECPWDDREGPSSDESGDDENVVESDGLRAGGALTDAQGQEVQRHLDRLAQLNKCTEAAENFPGLQLAIASVRSRVEKESSGRSQKDAVGAAAVRRQAELDSEQDAAIRRDIEERRRKRDADDEAFALAMRGLEEKMEELRTAEREAARLGAQAEEVRRQRARREAVERASRGFHLAELGQGQRGGGGERMRLNRFELLESVRRLGAELSADEEAGWKRWLRRLDEKGVESFKERWAAKLKHDLVQVLANLQRGDERAFIKWKVHISRQLHTDYPDITVPAALPAP